jgi:hypothetical protein
MIRPVIAVLLAVPLLAQPTLTPAGIQDILRRARQADDANALIEQNYVFEQRTETKQVDSSGQVKSKEVETYDTILSGGRPYRRLIRKNDKPLPPAEEKKEQARQQKEIDDRNKETPAEREKALAKEEARRQKNRELAHEAEDAFQFRLVSEDAANWQFELTPRPGFQPHSRETAVLKHFRGHLWISKKDYNWTKLDVEATDDVSFGLVIARLDKGAHFVAERIRVNDEVWLPKRIAGGLAARVALIKKYRIEFETTSSHFRRFSSDSKLVTEPLK